VNQRGRETDSAPGFSCWPKLIALCAYSRPVQGIAECARSAPRFGSSYCRRSLQHLQVGSDTLAPIASISVVVAPRNAFQAGGRVNSILNARRATTGGRSILLHAE
jgi:hypothetical protein